MSSIAPWLLPVLWREHDWRAALERLTQAAARAPKKAVDLGRALEYIEPDRKRAIAAYELGGDRVRALELATELGWWSARARLVQASRTTAVTGELLLDEAEAWWDAGQPDLCALALAGVKLSHRGLRGEQLAALLADLELEDRSDEAVAKAGAAEGPEAGAAFVMAARLSQAAGQLNHVTRLLEAAITADPKNVIAAQFLLDLAKRQRDPAAIERYLRVRLEHADLDTWLEATRTTALALIETEHHRGFGLRLLRRALERSYEAQIEHIPGHIAMWTMLAAHAGNDGTRRDLLPFVVTALGEAKNEVDRVWLGALATEISLRDTKLPVVAGQYAEFVAEHAPEHPIVRELVSAVAHAEDEPTSPVSIPAEAIAAAKLDVASEPVPPYVEPDDDDEMPVEVVGPDEDDELDDEPAIIESKPPLERVIAGERARGARRPEPEPDAVTQPLEPVGAAAALEVADASEVESTAPDPVRVVRADSELEVVVQALEAAVARADAEPVLRAGATARPDSEPVVRGNRADSEPEVIVQIADDDEPEVVVQVAADDADLEVVVQEPEPAEPAVPAPVVRIATMPLPSVTKKPWIAPASIAKKPTPAKPSPIVPASIVPPSIANPASIIPAIPSPPKGAKIGAVKLKRMATSDLPTVPRAIANDGDRRHERAMPVLAALRKADRPQMPPRPTAPPNAKLRARRITIPIDVHLLLADDVRVSGHSRDISATGLFVMTDATLPLGDELEIELMLPGKEAFTEETHRTRARVARRNEDGYGLELLAPDAALVEALDALG